MLLSTERRHRPQIDTLRALAVTGVLYCHFWDLGSPLAHLGVRLFFVISGYLITGILLQCRSSIEDGYSGYRSTLGHFFARRMLRIFPAYYAVLLLAAAVNLQEIRDAFWWHATHTSNILFAIRGDYIPWVTAHFWSLSIEEQFYLFWPFVIVLMPRRFLTATIVGTILFGIGFRVAAVPLHISDFARGFLTPSSLDALGAGGLLAILESRVGFPRWLSGAGLAAAGAYLALTLVPLGGSYEPWYAVLETLHVLPMVALVAQASLGFGGLAGRLLSTPVTLYLGRISFGIYLYHLFVLAAIRKLAAVLGVPFVRGPWLFVVASSATIIVAALSWRWLEQPCNRLKRNFPYQEKLYVAVNHR